MKTIKGHRSFDSSEIIEMLVQHGNYTCPTLPHLRFSRVKEACRGLKRLGLIEVSGRTPSYENLVPTPLFKRWRGELDAGRTQLGAIRWTKAWGGRAEA